MRLCAILDDQVSRLDFITRLGDHIIIKMTIYYRNNIIIFNII